MTDVRELQVGQTHLAHAAMSELRSPDAADVDRFVARVDTVQRPQGYQLLAAFDPDDESAAVVAGFRFIANLAWGGILSIDDLSMSLGRRAPTVPRRPWSASLACSGGRWRCGLGAGRRSGVCRAPSGTRMWSGPF